MSYGVHTQQNARIASKYLNIISNSQGAETPRDLWQALKDAASRDPKGLEDFLEFTKGLTRTA